MKEELLKEVISEKFYVNKNDSTTTDAPDVVALFSSLSKQEKREIQIEVENRILLRKQAYFFQQIEAW